MTLDPASVVYGAESFPQDSLLSWLWGLQFSSQRSSLLSWSRGSLASLLQGSLFSLLLVL